MDPIVEHKLLAIVRNEATITSVAQELGVSRQTVYKWLSRYKRANRAAAQALRTRKTGAHNKVRSEIEQVIIRVATEYPKDSVTALTARLEKDYKIVLNAATVFRILKRNNIRYSTEMLSSTEIAPHPEAIPALGEVADVLPSVENNQAPVIEVPAVQAVIQPVPQTVSRMPVATPSFFPWRQIGAAMMIVSTTFVAGIGLFHTGVHGKALVSTNEVEAIVPFNEDTLDAFKVMQSGAVVVTPSFASVTKHAGFYKAITALSPKQFSQAKITGTLRSIATAPKVSSLALVPFEQYSTYALGGYKLAQAKTSDVSSTKKTLSFLDRLSLSLYCGVASFSSSIRSDRCNYDTLIAQANGAPTVFGYEVVPVGTSTQDLAATSTSQTLATVAGVRPAINYVTTYVTNYVPVPGPEGVPGRDGRDGKDGRDGLASVNGTSMTPGYGSFVQPVVSSPNTIGISTIGYLKDTTIDTSTINGGTATNLSLSTPTLSNSVFNGSSIFNGPSQFLGNVVIGDLAVGSSTLGSFTSTTGSVTNLSVDSLTVGSSTTGSLLLNGSLTVNGTSTFATTSITSAHIDSLSVGTSSANSMVLTGTLDVGGTTTLATTTVSQATIAEATLTNATSSTFFSTLFTALTGLFTNLTATNATTTNLVADKATTTTLFSANSFLTNSVITNGTSTNWFTQNLAVGNASTTGNQTIDGTLTVSGTTTLLQNTDIQGSIKLGADNNDFITVNGLINSHMVPAANKIYDIGSPSFFWRNMYADNITVNTITAGTSNIGGTDAQNFTINSDNATTDAEDMSLVFFRGLVTPNAIIRWNSLTKRLESNMSFKIQNETPVTGTTTLTVQAGAGQGTTNLFELKTATGSTTSVFDGQGRLGIGTTTPGSSLVVVGQTSLQNASSSNLTVAGTLYAPLISGVGSFTAGSITATSSLASQGTLSVSSTSTLATTTITNGTITTLSVTNATSTNFGSTNLNTTNATLTNATSTTFFSNLLSAVTGIFTNLTSTNATSTNLFTSVLNTVTGTINTLTGGSITGGTVTATSSLVANGTLNVTGQTTLSTASSTGFSATNLYGTNGTIGNLTTTNGTITNASTTNLTVANNAYFGGNTGIWNGSGNVGVGTTNPGYKLDVQGSAGFTSNVTLTGGNLHFQKGGTASLGTLDNYDLAFFTNGTDKVTIKNSGNVGIGTTTPLSKLSVVSNSALTLGALIQNTDNNPGANVLSVSNPNRGDNSDYYLLNASNFNGSKFYVRGDGNVGIGTTAPGAKLAIQATATSTPNDGTNAQRLEYLGGSNSGDRGAGLVFAQRWYSGAPNHIVRTGGIYGVKEAEDGNFGGGLAFYTQPINTGADMSEVMRISGSGKVGIGTTNPNYMLQVGSNASVSASNGRIAIGRTDGTSCSVGCRVATLGYDSGYNFGIFDNNTTMQFGVNFAAPANSLYVAGSGNVGIGAINPQNNLQISKNSTINNEDSAGFSILSASGDSELLLGADAASDVSYIQSLQDSTNWGTRPLALQPNAGNVGIGTTGPVAKLSVSGGDTMTAGWNRTATLEATFPVLGFNSGNAKYAGIGYDSGYGLRFWVNGATNDIPAGTNALTILNGGNVGIGVGNPISSLQTSGTLTVGGGASAGIPGTAQIRSGDASPISNRLTYGTDGTGWKFAISKNQSGAITDQFVIQDNGNIGIGTTNPQDRFNVNGAAFIQGSQAGVRLGDGGGYGYVSAYDQNISGTKALVLQTNGGNVGIGTTNPAGYKLNVEGTGYYGGQVTINGFGNNAGLSFRDGFDPSNVGVRAKDIAGTGNRDGLELLGYNGLDFTVNNGNSVAMHINGVSGSGGMGNVGIGTTAPGLKLSVAGNPGAPATSGTTQTNGSLRIQSNTGNSQVLDMGVYNASPYGSWIQATNSGNLGDYYQLSLQPNGGNVGIGTNNPGAKLQIGSPGVDNPELLRLATGYGINSGARGAITWADATNITGQIDTRYNGSTVDMYFGSLYNSGYNSTTRMVLTGAGNLGIGTASPNSRLDVRGSANAYGDFGILTASDGTNGLTMGYDTGTNMAWMYARSTGCCGRTLDINHSVYAEAGGNVGIGATPGAYKLDVSGAAHVSSSLTVDGGGTYQGANHFRSNKGSGSYVAGQNDYSLQAFSDDGGAAGMSFHRGGYYAVNMGLDPDNVLRIGGWSAPANVWQLDMSGNEVLLGNLGIGGSSAGKGLSLGANAGGAGTASTGIWFGGSGVAHGNFAWEPNERTFILRSGNTTTQTTDSYGTTNLDITGSLKAGGANFQGDVLLSGTANAYKTRTAFTPSGSGAKWIRIPYNYQNQGALPLHLYVTRSINDNGGIPYGGPSLELTCMGREWHAGQQFCTAMYGYHGNGGAEITNAAVVDNAAGGYYVYLRVMGGVTYTITVASDSGYLGAPEDNATGAPTISSSNTLSAGYNIIGDNAPNLTVAGKISAGTTATDGTLTVQGNNTTAAIKAVGTIDNIASSALAPKVAGSVQIGSGNVAGPRNLFVQGNYAYVLNYGSSTMSVIDISNAASPTVISTIATSGTTPYSIYVVGRYAYVVNTDSNNLSIIDISNPASPSVTATIGTDSSPHSVFVSGRYAYVANSGSDTISIFNISNPSSPSLVSTTSTSASTGPEDIFVSGRYAYVTRQSSNNLAIFDVNTPSAPVFTGSATTGSAPTGLYVSERYAYVVSALDNTLSVIDVANPSAPSRVGTVTTGSLPNGVFVSGRYAYIANWSSGTMQTVDVANPTAPVVVNSVSTGYSNPYGVFASGRYVYVTNPGNARLSIIDVYGTETTAALVHSLEAGQAQIRNDLSVQGNTFTNALSAVNGYIENLSAKMLSLSSLALGKVSNLTTTLGVGGNVDISQGDILNKPVVAVNTPGNAVSYGSIVQFPSYITPSTNVVKIDSSRVAATTAYFYDSCGEGCVITDVYVSIGTYIDTQLSWATPIRVGTSTVGNPIYPNEISISPMGTGGKFVIAWMSNSTINSRVCDVLGTSLSCGALNSSPGITSANNSSTPGDGTISVTGLDASNFILAVDTNTASSSKVVVGQAASNTITYGTPVTIEAYNLSYISAKTLSSTKFVLNYAIKNGAGKSVIGDVSGTTITLGTPVTFNSLQTSYISTDPIPGTSSYIVTFQDTGNGNAGGAMIASYSGNVPTFGSKYYFMPGTTKFTAVAALDATSVAISFQNTNDNLGYSIIGNITSGNVLSFGTKVRYNTGLSYASAVSAAALTSTTFITDFTIASSEGSMTTHYGVIGKKPASSTYVSTSNGSFGQIPNGLTSAGFNKVTSLTKLDNTHVAALVQTQYDWCGEGCGGQYFDVSIGTYVDDQVAWGTPQRLTNAVSAGQSMVKGQGGVSAMGSNKLVAVYYTYSSIWAQVCTVAGTSLSCGAAYNIGTMSNTTDKLSVKALDSSRFVVAWDINNGSQTVVTVGNAAATTITTGVNYTIESADFDNIDVEALSSTKFAIGYSLKTTGAGKVIIGDVSGTSTVSFGTPVTFNSLSTGYISLEAIPTTSTFAIGYQDTGTGNAGAVILASYSGNTITLGNKYYFAPGNTKYVSVAALDSSTLAVSYTDTNQNLVYAITGSISSGVITYGVKSKVNTSTNASYSENVALSSTSFLTNYTQNTDGSYSTQAGVVSKTTTDSTLLKSLYVVNDGTVGIGTKDTISTVALTVNGDIRLGNAGSNGCIQSYNGGILAGGCSSDERLKTGITDLHGMLDRFMDLRVINFKWNETAHQALNYSMESMQTGFLAQNVESIFPEAVTTDQYGYKRVDYTMLSLYTTKALTEMSFKHVTDTATVNLYQPDEAVDAYMLVSFSTTTHPWSPKGISSAMSTASSTEDMYEIAGIRKAFQLDPVFGVVTTLSTSTVAAYGQSGVAVVSSGRTPVRVTSENGEIGVGDYLTVSTSTPGYAMKYTGIGHIVGRAISSSVPGKDTVVMVFDKTAFQIDFASDDATTTIKLTTGNLDLDANGVAIVNIKSLASANGTWSIDENGRITAKSLCIDGNCLDGENVGDILATSKRNSTMQVVGPYGYVLNAKTHTLTVLDMSSEGTTTILATLDMAPGVSTLAANGTMLYVSNDDSTMIYIVDISIPSDPKIARTIDVTAATLAGNQQSAPQIEAPLQGGIVAGTSTEASPVPETPETPSETGTSTPAVAPPAEEPEVEQEPSLSQETFDSNASGFTTPDPSPAPSEGGVSVAE